MAQQRTLPERVADVKTTFAQFSELLTTQDMRELREQWQSAQASAAQSGNGQLYAELVAATLSLQRIVAANDRAALIAAVLATQSGVARPILDVIDGEA